MGTPHPPETSLLFISLLFSRREIFQSVVKLLLHRFGDTVVESKVCLWDHSHYYDNELGTPIFKKLLFFKRQFDPLCLPDVKLETNDIETAYAIEGKRKINIDPGYLMRSRVVLASAKDYSHRIYLGKGIYGEVALYYQGNHFNPLPYTYFDYREPGTIELFEKARKELRHVEGS